MTAHRRSNHLFPLDPAASPRVSHAFPGRTTAFDQFAAAGRLKSGLTRLLMGAVRLYQITLSPFLGGQCRFHPTCSTYALQALESHGPFKGAGLAIKRLLKCHPFHPGGFDPPPGNGE